MKKSFLVLLAAVLLSGCVRYDVTLNNGTKLTNVRKPVYDNETEQYVIKTATGKPMRVPAGRVVRIAPHEEVKIKGVKGQKADSSFFLN